MTTAVLLCEGACNPSFERITQALDAEHRAGELISLSTRQRFRSLVVTPHVWTPALARTDNYTCTICGRSRRFGNQEPPPRAPLPMLE